MSASLTVARPQRLGWIAGGALVGVLGALLIAPAFSSVRAQSTEEVTTEHFISVTGTGTVSVEPDTADITVGVTVERDNAAAAAADSANVMAAVIAAIKALGVDDKDIQTTSLSLTGVYDYNVNPARLTGHQATNQVTVTVRDIAQTGAVVDAATGAGATDVHSISFRLDDQSSAEAAAREEAVKSARTIADTLAAAAGVEITGVISISENSSPMPPPIFYSGRDAAMEADQAGTPVQAGTIDLTVVVTIVYSIP